MKKDTALNNPYATPGQLLEIANSFSSLLTKKLKESLTFHQAEQIVGKKSKFIWEKANAVGDEFLQLPIDTFGKKKEQLTQFFKEIFNIELNIKYRVIPEPKGDSFSAIMANPIPAGVINEDDIIVAYKKMGIDCYLDLNDTDLRNAIKGQQERPKEQYYFLYSDTPLSGYYEDKGLSFDKALLKSFSFMTLGERLLTGLFAWWRDRSHWDHIMGTTRAITMTSSITEDRSFEKKRSCISIYYNGQLKIRTHNADSVDSDIYPRRIILL